MEKKERWLCPFSKKNLRNSIANYRFLATYIQRRIFENLLCEYLSLVSLTDWIRSLHNKYALDCVYIDFPEAFNLVPMLFLTTKILSSVFMGNS